MTLFTVTAWCDRTFYSQFDIEAESPEAALGLAKDQVDHEPAEECDDDYPWDTFSVHGADGDKPLFWQDDQAKLRESAPKLLAACQMVVDRWEKGDLAEAARACAEAIHAAWRAA